MNEPVTETALTAAKIDKLSKEMVYTPFGADAEIVLSIALVRNTLAVKTKKGCLPSDTDCIKYMLMAKSRALNPFEGDCFLIGYDTQDGPQFSIITAHQAFMKRAEQHKDYDGMESGVVVRDKNSKAILELQTDFLLPEHELIGGWAKVHHKTKRFPTYRKVNLTTFKKSFGCWVNNSAGMIVKCAEADALRSAFPTKLGGMYLREELEAQPAADTPAPTAPSAPPPMFNMPEPQKTLPAAAAPSAQFQQAEPEEEPQPEPEESDEVPGLEPAVLPSQGKTFEQLVALIHQRLKEDDVTNDQLVAYCKIEKLCGNKVESFEQMADSKLRTVVDTWPTILPGIKEIVV